MGVRNAIGVSLLWYAASLGFMVMPPIAGVALIALLAGSFYWLFMRGATNAEWRARLRLEPIRPPVAPVALAGAAFAVLYAVLLILWARITPSTVSPTSGPVVDYLGRPYGQLTFIALSVVLGPLIEEYLFRGVLQGTLERHVGPAAAIATAAAIFSIAHANRWAIPTYFVYGLATGCVVYRAGSLWAGVALHAATNAWLILLSSLADRGVALGEMERSPLPTWALALLGGLALLALVHALRRMPHGEAMPGPTALPRPAGVEQPARPVS
jgi:membrane protease YdiL (CAAX protease family)